MNEKISIDEMIRRIVREEVRHAMWKEESLTRARGIRVAMDANRNAGGREKS